MTIVNVANTSTTAAVATLLSNATASSINAVPSVSPTSDRAAARSSRDPFDAVNLSDHAKATLARARTDRAAADRLTSQLHSVSRSGAKGATQSVAYDKISTSFMALAGLSADDLKPAYELTVPMVSFTSSMQAFGFSISATGNADTWSSDIQIRGPGGFSAWDTIWGGGKGNPTAGGGGLASSSGQQFMARKENGKVYFTISDLSASASAIATDDISASSASAHYDSTTFTVDFKTGQISVERTEMSAMMISVDQK